MYELFSHSERRANSFRNLMPTSVIGPTFKAEILETLPNDTALHQVLRFPMEKTVRQDGLIVSVETESSKKWTAMFAFGYPEFSGVSSGLFASWKSNELCIVSRGAAYFVDTEDPLSCRLMPVDPVREVISIAKIQALLLVENTRLLVASKDGSLWKSGRLVVDDLRFERVEDTESIVLSGWDPIESERYEVSVSVADYRSSY